MLICIGGFPGSGKRPLAQGVAQKLGYHYYDINQKTLRSAVFTKAGVQETLHHPSSDEQRALMYRRVLRDFPMLSKMYPNVVIDNTFHRAGPRDAFFRDARRHFDDVVVLWVETDDADEFERGSDTRSVLARKRQLIQKEFQAFDTPIPTFSYGGALEAAQEAFYRFVRKELDVLLA